MQASHQAQREKLVGLAVWIGVVFVMFAGSVLLLL